jgi:nucleotide-binding universal stress UspA family protein
MRRPETMKPLGTHAPSRARTRGRVRTQIFRGVIEAGSENPYKIARASVDDATEVLRRSGNNFEITGDIVEGSPKRAILDEAEAWVADLIVVGSHGRRGLDRFLLGSVSQAVALHAHCSVEIVRARAAKAVTYRLTG